MKNGSKIVESINNLQPQVVEAIKKQVKDEIKAEVIKELTEDVQSGRLRLSVEQAINKRR